MDAGGTIAVICVLIILSAYFSATETAFSSINKIRIKNLAQEGNKKAKLSLKLCEKFDSVLSTILIGNNIVNILCSSLTTALFLELLGESGVAIATLVTTVVVLIFGEISPKSMAKEKPEQFAMFSAPVINFLCYIFAPINFLFTQLKKGITAIFHLSGDSGMTEAEFLTMVEEAQSEGGIEEGEGELIKSVIEFYDLDVSDILIPRVDVIAVDFEDSKEEIDNVFKETRFSRLPVYKETIDNIIGIINYKDFQYKVMVENESIDSVMSRPVYVSENMKISNLLKLLQQKKSHLAVVTDEYGGTVGVVTLEDVIEELVGEIWDEHDEVIEDILEISENVYKISCNANLDRLEDIFDLEIESESTTIGGWVTEMLERIPDVGDSFTYENLSVLVTSADERRVLEIEVTIEPEETVEE